MDSQLGSAKRKKFGVVIICSEPDLGAGERLRSEMPRREVACVSVRIERGTLPTQSFRDGYHSRDTATKDRFEPGYEKGETTDTIPR